MTVTEVTSKRGKPADDRDEAVSSPPPESRTATTRRMEIRPFLITLTAVALAGLLGWAMWGAYMGAPWTRDATLRAYVVTMAPEDARRIVHLALVHTHSVRKRHPLLALTPPTSTIPSSHTH